MQIEVTAICTISRLWLRCQLPT